MRTFRAGVPASLILVGLLAAACVSTVPAATAPPATAVPTAVPATPTLAPPTEVPTAPPTEVPTAPPTDAPTDAPTAPPTDAPTGAPTDEPTDAPDAPPDGWAGTAIPYRGNDGQRYSIKCPPGGEPRTIWGTTFYTDDSSICTAAVHRGAITLESGGTVTYEIAPGQEDYEGSEQNGITSLNYGAWGGTFVIVIE